MNTCSYNRLLMSPDFYETFADFDYILLYQLDAFVFYDAPENFCRLGFDYIGAPWPRMYRHDRTKIISCVGNGGFSLRNVQAHYNLLVSCPDLIADWHAKQYPEDNFFSYCGKRGDCNFNVAPVNVAYKFSAEFNPARVVKKMAANFRSAVTRGTITIRNFTREFFGNSATICNCLQTRRTPLTWICSNGL